MKYSETVPIEVIHPSLSSKASRLSLYFGATKRPPLYETLELRSEKITRLVLSRVFPILFTAAKSASSPVSAVPVAIASTVLMPAAYSDVSRDIPYFSNIPCSIPI